jgi:hypothetical protein
VRPSLWQTLWIIWSAASLAAGCAKSIPREIRDTAGDALQNPLIAVSLDLILASVSVLSNEVRFFVRRTTTLPGVGIRQRTSL